MSESVKLVKVHPGTYYINVEGYRYRVRRGILDDQEFPWVIDIFHTDTVSGIQVPVGHSVYTFGQDTLNDCRAWIAAHQDGTGPMNSHQRARDADAVVFNQH